MEIAGYIVTAGKGCERHFFWPDERQLAESQCDELVENGFCDVRIKPICLCENVIQTKKD